MLCNREQIVLFHRNRNSLQDGGEYSVPCGDCDLLLLDALPFLRSVALQLLWRRSVCVVDSAVWIGAHFHDLAAMAAVHDDSFRHLFARLLEGRLFLYASVRLGFLDMQ